MCIRDSSEGADSTCDRFVRDDEHFRCTVGDDVLPVLVELGFVHGHNGAAKHVGRPCDDCPLNSVVADDGDPVSPSDTKTRQSAAHPIYQVTELSIRDPVPLRTDLGPEQRAFRELAHASLVNVNERIEALRQFGHSSSWSYGRIDAALR